MLVKAVHADALGADQRVVGFFVDDRQRLVLVDVYTRTTLLVVLLFEVVQTQIQLAVFVIEELTATVGRTGNEVVETLVILYQVGLQELTHLDAVSCDGMDVVEVVCHTAVKRVLCETSLCQNTIVQLVIHDIPHQFLVDIRATVLVECQLVVGTVYMQRHVDILSVFIAFILRDNLIHIIVLGNLLLYIIDGL